MKKLYVAVAVLIAVAITEGCRKLTIAETTGTAKGVEAVK